VKICKGWIEIREADNYWHSVMRITALIPQAPDVTAVLFDVDNLKAVKPIASNRGMPHDISDEVAFDYDKDKEWAHFDTWVRPSEVAKVFTVKKIIKGWSVVFSLMGVLAEIYDDVNVRLICWFI
jgi:hypothetical protein